MTQQQINEGEAAMANERPDPVVESHTCRLAHDLGVSAKHLRRCERLVRRLETDRHYAVFESRVYGALFAIDRLHRRGSLGKRNAKQEAEWAIDLFTPDL